MFRLHVLTLACCLAICGAAWGQPQQKVVLKSGVTYTGVVTEVDGTYSIETRFGTISVPKADVASVEEVVTPEAEYVKRRAEIDAADPEQHVELGRWAMNKGLLEQARDEFAEALKIRSDYELAGLLLRQVEVRLAAQAAQPSTPTAPGAAPGAVPGGAAVRVDPEWLVTDEEISRIRVEELRENDRVIVTFQNDLLNRYLEMMQGRGDFANAGFDRVFRGYPPVRKARYIIDHLERGEEDLKRDIVVKSDPTTMREFRSRIMPIITAYCATSSCHGGEAIDKDKLYLLPSAGRNPRVDYTNFLILDRYSAGGRKMIDRDRPEDSLLLQYGLPPEQAKVPHPVKIKPAYTTRNTSNYRRVMSWIESLNGPPHPNYGVELRIPWAKAAPAAGALGDMEGEMPAEQPAAPGEGEAAPEESEPQDDGGAPTPPDDGLFGP